MYFHWWLGGGGIRPSPLYRPKLSRIHAPNPQWRILDPTLTLTTYSFSQRATDNKISQKHTASVYFHVCR